MFLTEENTVTESFDKEVASLHESQNRLVEVVGPT